MKKRAIKISEPELHELYVEQKLSAKDIAKKYNCNAKTIYELLRSYGVPVRSKSEAAYAFYGFEIAEADLRALYVEQGLSTEEIARRYGCSSYTLRKRLQSFGISIRSHSQAALIKLGTLDQLEDFSGDPLEKAQLAGFSTGDLTVVKVCEGSESIVVEGSSTRPEQIELIQQLFQRYGRVSIYSQPHEQYIRVSLNSSFAFLLEKLDYIPSWILENEQRFIAFFSGLVDAEGSFQIRHMQECTPRSRFSVSMTNKHLMAQCHEKLMALGIRCGDLRMTRRAGTVNQYGVRTRKDVWGFEVAGKESLCYLIALLSPYLRHATRRADMQRVKENVEWRMSETFREDLKKCRREFLQKLRERKKA